MTSPPRLPPLSVPEVLSPQFDQSGTASFQYMPLSNGAITPTATNSALNLALNSPEGISCYGNERLFLYEQGQFCNQNKLSDITLIVGGHKFFAHKMILIRASDVFERMLMGDWTDSGKKELELVEEQMCVSVFPRFLKYLYSCNIALNLENSLPVLVLADKYNIMDLQTVCINFACSYIIPKLQLKDVFYVWFQYATKCYHPQLVHSCIKAMAEKMDEIIGSIEWEREWIGLDKDQLIEFLNCSDLKVKDEYDLWTAAVRWLSSTSFPKRVEQFKDNLKDILPFIRFPMMTAEQIYEVESSLVATEYPDVMYKYFMMAYKYHALPLSMRACVKEFNSQGFLLRNYSDLRWDCRFVVSNFTSCQKGEEKGIRFSTKASSYPSQTWDWELKVYPKGISTTSEDFRVVLYSNLILDQPRPMEYLLSLVGANEILYSVCGKKNFSKTRYMIDTELDKKVTLGELYQPSSPLLVDNSLILQIVLKPAE